MILCIIFIIFILIFSFGLSENYITLHEHPVRLNALKLLMNTFTWDAVMNAFVHETERESMV